MPKWRNPVFPILKWVWSIWDPVIMFRYITYLPSVVYKKLGSKFLWYSRFCSAYSVTRASLSNLPQTGVDPTHNPAYGVKYRRGVCSLGARRGQPGNQMWQTAVNLCRLMNRGNRSTTIYFTLHMHAYRVHLVQWSWVRPTAVAWISMLQL